MNCYVGSDLHVNFFYFFRFSLSLNFFVADVAFTTANYHGRWWKLLSWVTAGVLKKFDFSSQGNSNFETLPAWLSFVGILLSFMFFFFLKKFVENIQLNKLGVESLNKQKHGSLVSISWINLRIIIPISMTPFAMTVADFLLLKMIWLELFKNMSIDGVYSKLKRAWW